MTCDWFSLGAHGTRSGRSSGDPDRRAAAEMLWCSACSYMLSRASCAPQAPTSAGAMFSGLVSHLPESSSCTLSHSMMSSGVKFVVVVVQTVAIQAMCIGLLWSNMLRWRLNTTTSFVVRQHAGTVWLLFYVTPATPDWLPLACENA